MVKGALAQTIEFPDTENLEQRVQTLQQFGEMLKNVDVKKLKKVDLFRPDWDSYFMLKAKDTAARSSCLSRPTGAIIVKGHRIIAAGYNGALADMPDCLSDGCCFRRACGLKEGTEDKYVDCRSAHAEHNAITYAARNGVEINGGILYTTLYPCSHCSKLVANAGIKEVVYELGYESGNKARDEKWKHELKSYGVKVRQHLLDASDLLKIIDSLVNITSSRRLKPTG